jgi:hypothetical protein
MQTSKKKLIFIYTAGAGNLKENIELTAQITFPT